ncbi:hypothetical protein GCM10025782_34930 [Pedococcus ginsenosidimutans]|uniref:Uncharacterized protein n=1 Tax=Pedococcus ginsenosidimutans TaxID=490570 RepID=A0ABP8YN31_9MICO
MLQTLQASLEGLQLTIELTPVVADDSGAFIEYAISSSKHGASQLPLVAPRRGTLLPLVTSWDRTWKERPPEVRFERVATFGMAQHGENSPPMLRVGPHRGLRDISSPGGAS